MVSAWLSARLQHIEGLDKHKFLVRDYIDETLT